MSSVFTASQNFLSWRLIGLETELIAPEETCSSRRRFIISLTSREPFPMPDPPERPNILQYSSSCIIHSSSNLSDIPERGVLMAFDRASTKNSSEDETIPMSTIHDLSGEFTFIYQLLGRPFSSMSK